MVGFFLPSEKTHKCKHIYTIYFDGYTCLFSSNLGVGMGGTLRTSYHLNLKVHQEKGV